MRRISQPILILIVLNAAFTFVACGGPDEGRVGTTDTHAGRDGDDAIDPTDVGVLDPSCAPRLVRALRPEPASAPRAIAIDDRRVAVAAGIGLELYAPEVPADGSAPALLGWVDLDGVGLDVALDGDLAAVAHGVDGVTVIDVADPHAPVIVAHVPSFGRAVGVALAGDRLVVADEAAGVAIWHLADRLEPTLVGRVALEQAAAGVALDDANDVVYVAAHTLGLIVVDLADGAPRVVTALSVEPPDAEWPIGDAARVRLAGGRAWVAAGYAGLRVFDLADPRAPVPSTGYWRPSNMILASDVALDLDHGRAYLADFWRQVNVLDVADPDAPKFLTSFTESDTTAGIAYGAGHAWVASAELEVFAVADASAEVKPTLVATFGHHSAWGTLQGVAVADGGRMVVADGPGAALVVRREADGSFVDLARYRSDDGVTAVALRGDTLIVARDTTHPMVLSSAIDVVALGAAAGEDGPVEVSASGSVALPGRVGALVFAGDDLVYGVNGTGLVLVDIADPHAPSVVTVLQDASMGGDRLAMDGDLVAVASNYRGVSLYDVRDRRAPVRVATWPATGQRAAAEVSGRDVWLGVGPTLVHVDATDPAAPRELSRLDLRGNVVDIAAAGRLVWVAAGSEVVVIDPTTDLPVAAKASAGRAPSALDADGDDVVVSDDFEALARLTLACDGPRAGFVPLDAGRPTPAGTQWVNLATGRDALAFAASPGPIGFTQATPPLTGAGPGDALGDELVIASGDADAPVVSRVPRLGRPDAEPLRARLRLIGADAGAVRATIRLGERRWDVGALARGQASAAFDLGIHEPAELWASDGRFGFAATLPYLAPGHSYELVLARAADGADRGGLYAVLVRDDGMTQQVGSAAHRAELRVVNLARGPLRVSLDDGDRVELARALGPSTSSATFDVAPGSRHLVARAGESDEIVFEQAVVPMEAGPSYTFVIYPREDGTLAGMRVTDAPEAGGATDTDLQLIHGAADLGTVTAHLIRDVNGEYTPAQTLSEIAPGSIAHLATDTASYDLAIDIDHDGNDDARWQLGYFPNYGFNLFLGRDANGVLRAGTQSVGDDTIHWRWTKQQLAGVRVFNLTGRDSIRVDVTPWFEPAGISDRIVKDGGTTEFQLLAGAQSVTLSDEVSGEAWTWHGVLDGLTSSTVVFDETEDGTVTSYVLRDTPLPATSPTQRSGLRIIHAASGPPVTAWLADTREATGIALGRIGPGEATPMLMATGDGPFAGQWIRIVPDGGTPLTFALEQTMPYAGATNIAFVDDAVWPYLAVQGPTYGSAVLFAEELQTRLRVVYLPTTQSTLRLAVDGGAEVRVEGRKTWGEDPPGFVGASPVMSLVAGAHSLTLELEDGSGARAQFERGYDLAAEGDAILVVYGDASAPSFALLDDRGFADGPAATVFNASASPIGVYVATDAASPWQPLAPSVAPGATSARMPLVDGGVRMAIDWGADARVDWEAMHPARPEHAWLFATASPAGNPLLLVLHRGAWPYLAGDRL